MNTTKSAASTVNRRQNAFKFLRNSSGNVAMMFGIAIVPIIGAVGMVVDYARHQDMTKEVALALDATAIGLARNQNLLNLTEDEINALAEQMFEANHTTVNNLNTWTVKASRLADKVEITFDGELDTTFAAMLGLSTMDVTGYTRVGWSNKKLEVALVLDTTGSMAGTKATKLKEAAHEMLNTLENTGAKIAVVPFNSNVNVGAHLNALEIDSTADAKYHGAYIDETSAEVNVFDLFDNLGVTWGGCVEARKNPGDWQDTPAGSQKNSKWVPYFFPATAYWQPYLESSAATYEEFGDVDQVIDPTAYVAANLDPAYPEGPNYLCNKNEVLPLTTSITSVRNTIDSLVFEGNTIIPQGLVWGWRALSADPPLTQGAAYSDSDTEKVLILMSDGVNWINEFYGGYGYWWDGRMTGGGNGDSTDTTSVDSQVADLTSHNKANAKLNDRIEKICSEIKDKKITVYSVGYGIGSDADALALKSVLEGCATDAEHYFDVDNSEGIVGIFKDIAVDMVGLRVTR